MGRPKNHDSHSFTFPSSSSYWLNFDRMKLPEDTSLGITSRTLPDSSSATQIISRSLLILSTIPPFPRRLLNFTYHSSISSKNRTNWTSHVDIGIFPELGTHWFDQLRVSSFDGYGAVLLMT
ncbi:hypothetical protein Droror1_Dr00006180 [Drosera rotundifolia]